VFEGLKRRGLLFSHLLYYSSFLHFSKLFGTKSLSFGRCDQELKSELGKKLKNEISQIDLEPERWDRPQRYDPNTANGTEIRYRMKKLLHFEIAQ